MWPEDSGQEAGKHSGIPAAAGWKGESWEAVEPDTPAARCPQGVGVGGVTGQDYRNKVDLLSYIALPLAVTAWWEHMHGGSGGGRGFF